SPSPCSQGRRRRWDQALRRRFHLSPLLSPNLLPVIPVFLRDRAAAHSPVRGCMNETAKGRQRPQARRPNQNHRRTRLQVEALEDRNLLAGNPIVTENLLTGTPENTWQVSGAGDSSIQGFATNISVNHGQTVSFKINDTANKAYHIDIYRMG